MDFWFLVSIMYFVPIMRFHATSASFHLIFTGVLHNVLLLLVARGEVVSGTLTLPLRARIMCGRFVVPAPFNLIFYRDELH